MTSRNKEKLKKILEKQRMTIKKFKTILEKEKQEKFSKNLEINDCLKIKRT